VHLPTARRFADWTSLGQHARESAAAAAVQRAYLLEPRLHAYVSFAQSAPAAAAGPLAGMPYGAKDIFVTTGRRPTCGLDHVIDIGSSGTAEVLSKLDQSDAIRIGFCAMTELAYEPSGYNAHQATPRNPWNSDFITGGSSSGSAVAVASGSVFFALGSDTGGSVRIPAHACGVTAWKPTYGRVSTTGAMPLAPTLDTIGIIARSAADLARPAAVLLGQRVEPLRVARVAVMADLIAAAEPDVRYACEAGVEAIAAAGVTVIRRDAGDAIEAIDRDALIILQGEPARVHRERLEDTAIDPVLRKRFAKGLAIDEATLAATRARRGILAKRFLDHVFAGADAVLLPVMPIRTPPRALCDPASEKFEARTLYRLSQWTRFVNMLGFPAVAMPTGFDDRGLPIALQIVGRPDHDLALVVLAEAAQKLTDWHGRVPAGIADLAGDAKMTP
jgi:aspartyl-tRNA(Asn)/glutamyl-tRNA(Gln) amidotransferase subunit A